MDLLLEYTYHPTWITDWEFVAGETVLSTASAPCIAIVAYLVSIFGLKLLMTNAKPLDDVVRMP